MPAFIPSAGSCRSSPAMAIVAPEATPEPEAPEEAGAEEAGEGVEVGEGEGVAARAEASRADGPP